MANVDAAASAVSPPPLPKIAAITLPDPIEPQSLVTFLNRSLKRRGLVFGIAQAASGGYEISIYETPAWHDSEDE